MKYAMRGVCLVGLLAGSGCERPPTPRIETKPPIVQVARPVEREVAEFAIFTGRTEALQDVNVQPRVTGYLTQINFVDGADVKEGDVLFEIDPRPYQAELEIAKGQVALEQAKLDRATENLNRAVRIQQENPGAASQKQIDDFRGDQGEAQGALLTAQANVAKQSLYLGWTKVTAPISGRIDRHFVDIGNLVTQNDTVLTTIVSLKPIWVYFDVDENTLLHIRRQIETGSVKSNRAAPFPVQMGLGVDRDFPYEGVIDFVSNQLDPNTGSIRVRAIFENKNGMLVAGLFGRMRVPISPPHNALLVTERAVGMDQGQRYVMVVNGKNEVELRVVDVGQIHDGLREVNRTRQIVQTSADGRRTMKDVPVLAATDRVIVNGLQRARPGATVDPRLVHMTTLLPESANSGQPLPASGPSSGVRYSQ